MLCILDVITISNFILVGDFNINYLSPTMFLYHHLQCIIDCFSLKQVVSEATHYSPSGQQSLIDLVLISFPERLISCDVIPQLGNSDHFGIQVRFAGKSKSVCVQNNSRRQVWHYNRADFELATDLLADRDLDTLIDPSDINLSWNKWKEAFLEIMAICIPRNYLPKRHNLPWLTKSLIQLIKKKNHLFRKARSTKDALVNVQYRTTRNKVVAKLRKSKQDYFQRLNPGNCKEFWKIVKYINKGQSSIPSLIVNCSSSELEVANTDSEKANALNKFFSTCFNHAFPPLSPDTSTLVHCLI